MTLKYRENICFCFEATGLQKISVQILILYFLHALGPLKRLGRVILGQNIIKSCNCCLTVFSNSISFCFSVIS